MPPAANQSNGLEDGLSLAELASALSAHGGGALSADLALDLVLNEIVEHARLATGATAAAIALARGDDIVCRATTGNNAPDLGVRLDSHSGLSGACVQSKKWQRCDDSEADPRVDAEVCRSLGVRSILVFPVMKEDRLLGVFEIFSPRPNAFSDREIQTLEALSRSIVNNVDSAADVLAPATSQFPAPSSATTVAIANSVMPEIASADHSLMDTPELAVEPPPEAVAASRAPLRDYWTTALTLAVIAVALFLGWMLGYGGKQKTPIATKVKVAAPAAAPVEAKPPELPTPAANGASATIAPAAPSAPAASSIIGSNQVPANDLVVYENGKVIYRAIPPPTARAAKRALMIPAKVADEYLTQRVEPEYPEQAREQHIQGPVVLVALVGKDGVVEKLNVVSGDPQLAAAASDAVQQWRFKPFFRNGAPEEFQTQITVSFRLP